MPGLHPIGGRGEFFTYERKRGTVGNMHAVSRDRFKKCIFVILSGILLIAVMAVIFYFSSQNAEESSESSGSLVGFLLELAVPGFGDLPESEQIALTESYQHIIRKTAHFSEFAALGFSVLLHIRCWEVYREKKWRYTWLKAWIAAALYAVSDELHQMFSEARAPQISDVLLDSCGAAFGVLVLILLFRIAVFFKNRSRP